MKLFIASLVLQIVLAFVLLYAFVATFGLVGLAILFLAVVAVSVALALYLVPDTE